MFWPVLQLSLNLTTMVNSPALSQLAHPIKQAARDRANSLACLLWVARGRGEDIFSSSLLQHGRQVRCSALLLSHCLQSVFLQEPGPPASEWHRLQWAGIMHINHWSWKSPSQTCLQLNVIDAFSQEVQQMSLTWVGLSKSNQQKAFEQSWRVR